MAYIDPSIATHQSGEKTPVGSGQCVALVQAWTRAPNTHSWKQGEKVKGNQNISRGTAIATFKDGIYPNHADGNHAALYLGQDSHGIRVLDQWRGHAPSVRTIHYKAGEGSMSNDGDAFYVIE